MNRIYQLMLSAMMLMTVSVAVAKDWPQWRGPDRNDISKETGLKQDWKKDAPKLLWTNREVGRGFSGTSVVGDKIYTLGCRNEEKDFVICIDAKTGKELWSTHFANFNNYDRGGGPRGNATVVDGMLYAIGPKGDIVAVDAEKGTIIWQKEFNKDLGGKLMSGWGYSESPLVDGDHVICTPGGAKGTLVALNKKTGEVVWRSKDLTDDAAYSSIIAAEIGGVKQYITLTKNATVGVAAKDGKLLWREVNNGFKIAVIPTVVVSGEYVFATAGYGAGCDLIKITGTGNSLKSEKVYSNKNMANHHGGVVLLKDHLFGYGDGHGWTCLNFKTGDIVWEDKSKQVIGKGAITYADDRLYCFGESDGALAIIEPSTEGWKERGRLELPEKTKLPRKGGQIWTHPVIANGKLYLRDLDLLFCFDISGVQ